MNNDIYIKATILDSLYNRYPQEKNINIPFKKKLKSGIDPYASLNSCLLIFSKWNNVICLT